MTSDLLETLQLAERQAEEVDRRERKGRSNAALELLKRVRFARIACEELMDQEHERCAACGK